MNQCGHFESGSGVEESNGVAAVSDSSSESVSLSSPRSESGFERGVWLGSMIVTVVVGRQVVCVVLLAYMVRMVESAAARIGVSVDELEVAVWTIVVGMRALAVVLDSGAEGTTSNTALSMVPISRTKL